MKRESCGACQGNRLTQVLDLGTSPLADRFPKEPEPEEVYPLNLLLCESCGLVQLGELVDDDRLFGKDYAFFTGSSPSLVETYRCYASEVLSAYPEQCRRGVVEIASNDGTLLEMFQQAGCPVMGVEPALPPAEHAAKRGVPTRIRAFSSQEAGAIINVSYGGHLGQKPGVVIANHVLAHVADPADFLLGVSLLLDREGVAVIEFQYFPDLFFGNEWDHVYHEHRSFFSLTTVATMASRAGLTVVDAVNSPRQGGSLRVTLKLSPATPHHRVEAMLARELRMSLGSPVTYANWQARVEYTRDRVRELIWEYVAQGKTVWGYGASAKSSTLLNYCGLDPTYLKAVEDTTPYKIGCYTPGTHIPIVSPSEEKPDAYLLLVWNYLEGVIRRERRYMEQGGHFIVPIPHPVVL